MAVQLSELAHEFLAAFIDHLRQDDADFDEQIAAAARGLRRAALAQAEALPRLRARRNPQLDRSLERGDLDARAEHGIVNADRQLDAEVVPLPAEDGVWLHVDGDVEIAVARAAASGVAAIGDAQARALVHAGRNCDRHAFAAHVQAVPRADRAARRPLTTGAGARGAAFREHHVSARPPHLAGSVARRAAAFRCP